ncbi:MAG: chorismate lyase, partial [Gallionella sp.]|nr:chorismate lyase [Gallionella sp.]
DNPPATLYARRSLFYLHGAPLLVTEVFLPEILELGCRIRNTAGSQQQSRDIPESRILNPVS